MHYGKWRNTKTEKWDLSGSWKLQISHLWFPIAPTVHLSYSHCWPILISLIQEQTLVTRTLGWQKSDNEGPVFVEVKWTLCTYATILQIQYEEDIVLFLTWWCFLCHLIHQISLISLTGFFGMFQGHFWKHSKISYRSKRLHLEFGFGNFVKNIPPKINK